MIETSPSPLRWPTTVDQNDNGTTTNRRELGIPIQNRHGKWDLEPIVPSEWIHYSHLTEVLEGDHVQLEDFRCIRPDGMRDIGQQLKKTTQEFQRSYGNTQLLATSGWMHGLVLQQEDTTAALLNGPPLMDSLSEQEQAVVEHLQQRFGPTFQVTKGSTLEKILTLRKHPGIIPTLLGRSARFEDLQLQSFQGFITDACGGPAGIPPGEFRTFGKSDLDLAAVQDVLRAFGIDPQQVVLRREATEQQPNGVICFTDVDFNVETKYIAGNITDEENQAIILSFESVGKIFGKRQVYPRSIKFVNGVSYRTTPMCGGVQPYVIAPMLLGTECRDIREVYAYISSMGHDICTMEHPPITDFLYFPESGKNGTLYRHEKETLTPVSLNEVKAYMSDQKKAVIAAAMLGVAWGMRSKMEDMRRENGISMTKPIFVYGGMMKPGQEGTTELLSQAMPAGAPIELIDIPSSGKAAGLLMTRWLLEKNGHPCELVMGRRPLATGGKFDSEYALWQRLKQQ